MDSEIGYYYLVQQGRTSVNSVCFPYATTKTTRPEYKYTVVFRDQTTEIEKWTQQDGHKKIEQISLYEGVWINNYFECFRWILQYLTIALLSKCSCLCAYTTVIDKLSGGLHILQFNLKIGSNQQT